MHSRRSFLGGALATLGTPPLAWAQAGGPRVLTAARTATGDFVLMGLRADGSAAFSIPLPDRGHAAAAHPTQAKAVAFARRPGTYASVIDCIAGIETHRMTAPKGRHFYGHGAFSMDGKTLFTTENDIATGAGRIGVWDAAGGFRRMGELSSGGVGPHEIIRLPGTDRFAVANGGIRTHPDQGRAKLNLDTMRPNLTVMDGAGTVLDVAALPGALHQNSLRHIASFGASFGAGSGAGPGAGTGAGIGADFGDGRVACAFQWQGDPFAAPSIAGIYQPGSGLRLVHMDDAVLYHLDGYAGSVGVTDASEMVLTFPRGGRLQVFDTASGSDKVLRQRDVCGVAGHLVTDGLGGVGRLAGDALVPLQQHPVSFDNHLVAVA